MEILARRREVAAVFAVPTAAAAASPSSAVSAALPLASYSIGPGQHAPAASQSYASTFLILIPWSDDG